MTIDEVKQILKEINSSPKRSLGQNFLISETVIARIINEVAERDCSELLEIGPGLGALTRSLVNLSLQKQVSYQVIELDRKFASYWRQKGVAVTEGDALKLDWQKFAFNNALLVSNLPYQISASLVIERSIKNCGVNQMVLMFQKEVGQRITAEASSTDYGLLSVIAQNFWQVKLVQDAGPRDFYPPPKVASRVLAFERKKQTEIDMPERFLKFVKSAFAQRRKLLVKNLSLFTQEVGRAKEDLAELLQKMGFSSTVRAEELSPQEFFQLYKELTAEP